MAGKRRKFDEEFRKGAVRIVAETGKPIAQVVKDLGINETTLASWVSRARRASGATAVGESEAFSTRTPASRCLPVRSCDTACPGTPLPRAPASHRPLGDRRPIVKKVACIAGGVVLGPMLLIAARRRTRQRQQRPGRLLRRWCVGCGFRGGRQAGGVDPQGRQQGLGVRSRAG
ncbi:transposase [Streptomyces lydicus]|uniref:transposase n=1 Tax=Streptomyces lydicus TaxID=47763 RepID=UPI001F514D89|nr:transposase [Streptomyces lydicus]